jgi:hypothetical protein
MPMAYTYMRELCAYACIFIRLCDIFYMVVRTHADVHEKRYYLFKKTICSSDVDVLMVATVEKYVLWYEKTCLLEHVHCWTVLIMHSSAYVCVCVRVCVCVCVHARVHVYVYCTCVQCVQESTAACLYMRWYARYNLFRNTLNVSTTKTCANVCINPYYASIVFAHSRTNCREQGALLSWETCLGIQELQGQDDGKHLGAVVASAYRARVSSVSNMHAF